VRLDFPLGATNGGESTIIQTGDGEFNQLFTLSAGYVFPGNKAYMTGHLGFNNRTKKFSDEWHYHYEAGYRIFPSFLVIGKLYGVESFFNGHVADNASGIFSNNMEQLVVHPQLAYTFKNNFGIALGSAIPLKGKNILADPIYDFSFFYQLRKK
jgi:hypothetical protein